MLGLRGLLGIGGRGGSGGKWLFVLSVEGCGGLVVLGMGRLYLLLGGLVSFCS